MIDLYYTGNELHNEINIIDSVENIPGRYQDYYKTFKVNFWTLDYNAERINGKSSPFKSDPWLLFHVYNETNKYQCNFSAVPDRKFVCLNFNPKPHRKKIIDCIQKLDSYYSDLSTNQKLTEIPEHYPNGYYKDRYDYGVPKEYFYSLIDVVAESYVDFSSHFSEKSYKPLFYKKPFITIAGPYYYATLKDYGFKLYDELFDYSFDTSEDAEERILNILTQLMDLNNKYHLDQ